VFLATTLIGNGPLSLGGGFHGVGLGVVTVHSG
jgi:hypothetical protein